MWFLWKSLITINKLGNIKPRGDWKQGLEKLLATQLKLMKVWDVMKIEKQYTMTNLTTEDKTTTTSCNFLCTKSWQNPAKSGVLNAVKVNIEKFVCVTGLTLWSHKFLYLQVW